MAVYAGRNGLRDDDDEDAAIFVEEVDLESTDAPPQIHAITAAAENGDVDALRLALDYDEPSSRNHANMQQRKPIKEDMLQDSNRRIKSTIKRGNSNSCSETGKHKRSRSQGKKQPRQDTEGSASNASKLDFRADRVWSKNQCRNWDDSSVSDKQSENSPSPHINKSQSRHCLVCRSRQADSHQRESISQKKSRASIRAIIHKGPTS